MKNILNIGIQPGYTKSLIRKIRISNLVALITLLVMLSYIPLSLILKTIPAIAVIVFFAVSAIVNFILHKYSRHTFAFFYFTFSGFIYFFFATILFGLESNIHYYFLVMCMISAVLFDKKWIINGFIALAIICFFALIFIMKDRYGYVITTPELIEIQEFVGYIVTLLLFIIAAIFFIFLKTENDNYQKEIIAQKEIIEEKHKEITDSINYAERIQRSFLATKNILDENLKNYFVYFQPKDVVSGDFYWASKLNNGNFALVCADSTGHGVPGAIMSILNISSLEKAIETQTEPHSILNETRKIIIDRLKKDGSAKGGKDGMDCTLLVFDPDHTQLTFAAAHNPVWIVRKNEKNSAELIEFKADKMPVGKHDRDFESFTNQTFKLQQNDMIYMLTDGIPDQFGGPKGKKYMHKNLKELLIAISSESVEIQKEKLDRSFKNWKADLEQIDDVCLIGVRI